MKSPIHRLKAWLVLLSWLSSLLIVFAPQAMAAAADFTYATVVTYHVNNDDSTDITESYTVTNNTARQYLAGIKLITPTNTVSDLVAKYADGTTIPTTTTKQSSKQGELSYTYQEIGLSFPRQSYGSGRTWDFSVSYKATGLVDTKGSSHTIYVPSIEAGNSGDTYTATLDVPAAFGNPHFAGAQAASAGVTDGRQYYNFGKADLVAHSLALAFGDSTIYHVNFNFPLDNDSPFAKTMTVALPPDLNNQKSYINSLDPAPRDTRLDEDGNVLADYRVKPHQHLIVKTDVSGLVNYLEYDLGASGKKSDIPSSLVAAYTSSTQYWQAGGEVAAQAKKLTDPSAPVINNVKAIYGYVISHLKYSSNKIKFNIRQGATAALNNPTNVVCLEYADLMIAMLRSQGIPAREPIGYAYSGNLKSSTAVSDSLHAWVEAYVPGIGWMTFDPTWGVKFDQFGKSDLDHFAFAVWGKQDSIPAAVMEGSNDRNYQYEKTILDYQSRVVPVANTGAISFHRYVILPFISLDRADLSAQTQVASDNNVLRIGTDSIALGSLAPSQRISLSHWVFGSSWNKASVAQLARRSNGSLIVLATTQFHPSYSVLIIVPLLALVVVLLALVVRWRSKRT